MTATSIARVVLLPSLVAGLFAVGLVEADTPEVEPSIPLKTDWISKADRKEVAHLDVSYANQDGETGKLEQLIDRPTVITFFYTRCQNGAKCSAALLQFTALQRELERLELVDKVRMLAITYEPEFDDPPRLKSFGGDRGLKFTDHTQALRLDSAKHESLIKALKAPVSFNGGTVNTHGVALHILDRKGGLVRQYRILLWDNEQVLEDLRKLLNEE